MASAFRRRLVLFRAIAVAAGTLVALLAGEAGLRIYSAATDPRGFRRLARAPTEPPPSFSQDCGSRSAHVISIVRLSPHPEVVYELKPDLDTCFLGARLQTNSQGLRALRDYEVPKPEGLYRLLLLGDSQAMGQGVEYPHTIAAVLERRLAQEIGRPVEVVNAGVDGYNTTQEAAFLKARGMSFEPDCVLLLFVANDLELPTFLLNPRRLGRWHLRDLWRKVRRRNDAVSPFDLLLLPEPDRVPEEYRHMVGFEGHRAALAWIAETAGEVPVVNFASFPSGRGWLEVPDYSLSVGIELPEFHFPVEPEYALSPTNRHLNAEGNRRVADQMLAGILQGACGRKLRAPRTSDE